MAFENDIFISYAHVDNEAVNAPNGWITLLHDRLAIRLHQLLGEKVKIWRDPKLQGNDEFADVLVINVAQVAVLLSVLSPRYLKSEWCSRELNLFCQQAEQSGGLVIDNKSRVFKVVKTYIPREQHPPALGGALGYEFYEYDEARDRAKEFRTDLDDRRYWDKFEDLALDISRQIIKLRHLSASAANEATPVTPSGNGHAANGLEKAVIYLAETTRDLTSERDRVRRELAQFGYRVVPDKELPLQGPELIATVNDYLQTARLSVHLVGAHYGIVPELEDRSIVRIQHDLAEARSSDPQFKRLIWMPSTLEAKEAKQQAFIEYLSNSPIALKNAELLREKLEDLKTVIQNQLNAQQTKALADPDAAQKSVYLICEQREMEATQPIYQCLYDAGFEVWLPAAGETALEDNQQNLRDCDALLVYYGQGNERWLRAQFSEFSKAIKDRTKPLLAKAIYVAPPESPPKKLFMTREAIVIKNFKDFDCQDLAPFFQAIGVQKGITR